MYFCISIFRYTMIQRIQTVYIILVALFTGALPFYLSLWTGTEGNTVFAIDITWVAVIFAASSALALITIFLFKNRKNQFVFNRLNIILNLFLLGFFVYRSLNLSGETSVSEKGIGLLIPIFTILLVVMANKAIKKDEELVKSVDRLR